ncbi:MAG: hypothetical protein RL699_784 [Bacteroidota bacterium]|jgi:uncharacterized protein (TIGR02145 family)
MRKHLLLLLLFFSVTISCTDEKKADNYISRPISPVVDGQVQIGSQNWMTKNLNVSKYTDGTPIPQVTDPTQWANLTTGAWCYYNNDPANGRIYGKLYNCYAVMGIYNATSAANSALRKKLAPTGWHVPTYAEWSSLINCLDPNADGGNNFPNIAGGKMKSTGTSLWQSPNTDATNASGFTGFPGGLRDGSGTFGDVGYFGMWWNSSDDGSSYAYYQYLYYSDGSVVRDINSRTYGFSVRCIKD